MRSVAEAPRLPPQWNELRAEPGCEGFLAQGASISGPSGADGLNSGGLQMMSIGERRHLP